MFWNNYYNLCQQHGSSPNAVAKILNISSGAVSEWKKGRVPQMATVKKVADYFGVSPETLTADQTIHVAEYSHIDYQLNDFSLRLFGVADKLTTTEQKLLALYNKIEDKEGLLRFIERLAALSEEQQKFVFDNLLQGQ
jgi:transcriptional regulator with XRE-family HTH domain